MKFTFYIKANSNQLCKFNTIQFTFKEKFTTFSKRPFKKAYTFEHQREENFFIVNFLFSFHVA